MSTWKVAPAQFWLVHKKPQRLKLCSIISEISIDGVREKLSGGPRCSRKWEFSPAVRYVTEPWGLYFKLQWRRWKAASPNPAARCAGGGRPLHSAASESPGLQRGSCFFNYWQWGNVARPLLPRGWRTRGGAIGTFPKCLKRIPGRSGWRTETWHYKRITDMGSCGWHYHKATTLYRTCTEGAGIE